MFDLSFGLFSFLQYELLFSVAEKENPPSLPIILSLMKQYPSVSAQVFQGDHFVENSISDCLLVTPFNLG